MTAQAGGTTSSKSALRSHLRQARTRLPLSKKRKAARSAAAHAYSLLLSLRARRIAVYLAHGSELDPSPLIRRFRGEVFVPRLTHSGMRFVALKGVVRKNRHGIREPAGLTPSRAAKKLDVIFLPLLGFDAYGTRLGQGGGHYDHALKFGRAFRRPVLVGYAYSMQQCAKLPREPHDKRLDAVITEKGFWNLRTALT